MTRRSVATALAAVLVIVTASTGSAAIRSGSPAADAGGPAAVVAGSNAAGHDYATDVFADPWDYSNLDDLIIGDTGPTMKASNLRFASGRLSTHFTANGYISPIWGGYGGPLFLGRDGGKPGNELNAARYKTVVFQAYSNRDVDAALIWFNCARALVKDPCSGGKSFTLRAGWHTYVLNPGASVMSGLPVAWGGTVNGLRLAVHPGAAGSDFALDWFRLVQPGSGAQLTWSNAGLGASEYVWDADANDANNLTGQTGWGVVDIPDVTGSSGTVDLSALPPGSFRIGVRSREGFSGWQSVSLASPLPQFITPNAVGDRDYASTVLRDPWDLNSASDVAKVGGAKDVSFANGQLAATNTSNDAFVSLRIGAGGIDSRTYRNLTVTSAYDGPFDLRDIAGGGTMARVQWWRAGGAKGQTDDILTYSGTRTVSIDMGLPNNQLIEPGTSQTSFLSPARITTLRWDPNEDRGARRWYLKDVQLRSDFSTKGTFPITWQDGAYQAGGTATIVADTDRSGCNGRTVASGVPVQAGTNTTVWNTAGVAPGRYWLCLTITRGAAVTSGYAGGVLSVGANP